MLGVRIGVCSDVHGRHDRLLTVLGAMAAAGVDERWCLGDLVGGEPVTPELVGAARQLDLLIACSGFSPRRLSPGSCPTAPWARSASLAIRTNLRSLPTTTQRRARSAPSRGQSYDWLGTGACMANPGAVCGNPRYAEPPAECPRSTRAMGCRAGGSDRMFGLSADATARRPPSLVEPSGITL